MLFSSRSRLATRCSLLAALLLSALSRVVDLVRYGARDDACFRGVSEPDAERMLRFRRQTMGELTRWVLSEREKVGEKWDEKNDECELRFVTARNNL